MLSGVYPPVVVDIVSCVVVIVIAGLNSIYLKRLKL